MKIIDKLEKEIEKDLYLHGIDTPFAREMINKYKSLGLLPLPEPITQPMPSEIISKMIEIIDYAPELNMGNYSEDQVEFEQCND
jgi:hypothetical protein